MVRDLRYDLDMINFFKRDSQIKFGLSYSQKKKNLVWVGFGYLGVREYKVGIGSNGDWVLGSSPPDPDLLWAIPNCRQNQEVSYLKIFGWYNCGERA